MPRALTGIRRKGRGWEVTQRVNGHLYSETFPLATPVQEMRDWRDDQVEQYEAPRRPLTPRRRGAAWTYFIQHDARVKIGRSRNVRARVAALQTASAVPLRLLVAVPATHASERALHRRFAHLRIAGEWFRLEADLNAYIRSLMSCPAN